MDFPGIILNSMPGNSSAYSFVYFPPQKIDKWDTLTGKLICLQFLSRKHDKGEKMFE